ncbi:hypothetical protein NIES4075_70360 [Tolypothrix sp. NIES-4075]|uniref:peptidoglycan-binding domain-containing protein n=1 Tax=Tolypothrix sp. NIES-4075 TaxID=2005459 RepID=UPI000B5CD086|nr:hypothetical protein [Tolypothrix sp. NIES-4075]GAX46015.1 hypothetical protein NIES4075_70360 [Tolypothrix sp. NIES-4075]
MSTLQDVISNSLSLTRAQLKADNRALVMEIQTKLANLGFYPGGGWIDGDLGSLNSFSWKGLIDFCRRVGSVSIPSEDVAINPDIALKLLETKQVEQINSILSAPGNTTLIFNKLKEIQNASPIVNRNTPASAFVARTINKSPFQTLINDYPAFLEQKPDGTFIISYGDSFTLSSGVTANFSDYPNRGIKPSIDETGLNFLSSNISHACVCVGSFTDSNSPIKTHWLGKKSIDKQQFYSVTKFIGVLNTICQINKNYPNIDVDDCVIESPKYRFNDLVKDMVKYQYEYGSSNAIGALFKRFIERPKLEQWIVEQTGNSGIKFLGAYGDNSLIANPKIKDTTTGKVILSSDGTGATGENLISAYDLVRLISMLGWHLHLPETAKLPSAQWKSLESVVRAMGNDTARYVDVALETLGVVNVISEPVIISKVGWGLGSMTYAALVKFVDQRVTQSKLRTFALALRCPTPASDDRERDTNLAVAVTEIVRRIINEELA